MSPGTGGVAQRSKAVIARLRCSREVHFWTNISRDGARAYTDRLSFQCWTFKVLPSTWLLHAITTLSQSGIRRAS
jgi:hypothetical protein